MSDADELTMRCIRVAMESAEADAKKLEDERQRLLVLDMFRQTRIALASYVKRSRIRAGVLAIVFLALTGTATADDKPAAPVPAQCVCPTDGAREGEDIAARVQRLEVEYRLARAELLVANLRKRRK